ncbi:MAG: enoyl-CoA hydratase/isomerase family protein [Candidatus Obscuribacterales bacterium]|nr:enoyl-CoA hydratase/isomerase family protein [Candidatus Obscuribacterales bacterium]
MAPSSMRMEKLASGIAVITFDLPGSKLNTLGFNSMTDLNELLEAVKSDSTVKGLVLLSGKKDSFIAGADVSEIKSIQGRSIEEAYNASQLGKEIFAKIANLPFNTVAAINGICLGGGTELTLACKYRVASENAKIGLPEIKLGFVPGWGGCVRLPRLIGLMKALDLIMTGRVLDAKKAWKLGVVSEVVSGANLRERAIEIAEKGGARTYGVDPKAVVMSLLLEKNAIGRSVVRDQAYKAMMRQTKGKYPAAKEALKLLFKSIELPESEAAKRESQVFARLAMSDVSRNLVGIFFAQQDSKKLPVEIADDQAVRKVGVLGAGVMGAGIAQAAVRAGLQVVLKDVNEEFLARGKENIKKLFASLVEKRKMTAQEVESLINSMTFTTEYGPLSDCDLVIEAVLEDIEVKKKVLAELEKVNPGNFIFGSNTSSLSIEKMAKAARNPANVVGVHFFNPVHKMPLVEIVRGNSTSPETIARATAFALKLDKTTVLTADSPGFVVNRILAPYLREAAILVEEGYAPEEIDRALKNFGMPMGPLSLLDEVGLDIAGKVVHVMRDALGERFAEPRLMRSIEELKLIGKKAGAGIYLYEDGKPAGLNPQFAAILPEHKKRAERNYLQDRLVLLMANEAVRCIEEKVVEGPSQLDLALIFGIGFPPFEGGILKYIDTAGAKVVCDKLGLLAQVHGFRYEPCALLKKKALLREPFYQRESAAELISSSL